MTPSETLLAVIKESDQSINMLARLSGVEQSSLHRFTTGERDIVLSTVDKLAAYFGLELVMEIDWDEHCNDQWPAIAEEQWKYYIPDAWRDALASGDWEDTQEDYEAWEEKEYAFWEPAERESWEAEERERLNALPWIRIVEE